MDMDGKLQTDRNVGGAAVKVAIVVALLAAVGTVVALKGSGAQGSKAGAGQGGDPPAAQPGDVLSSQASSPQGAQGTDPKVALPRLVDLGAGKCIPCKLMAPILEALKKDFAGSLEVVFIDVWEKPDEAKKYDIQLIPTQIFYDSTGKEKFRHQGFFSREDILAKWKELGVDLAASPSGVVRETPLAKDDRAPDQKCYMCDGDVGPKTRVTIDSKDGKVHLCSPHCLFIVLSSLKDRQSVSGKMTVTDWMTSGPLTAERASYLYSSDERGRPIVRAFASADTAVAERQKTGGDILVWSGLEAKETAVRCAFCDRANYPVDSCPVKVEGVQMYACCPMCGLGVAARLKKDIDLEVKDGLKGNPVRVKTLNGSVGSLSPETAVAWHGQVKGADGKMSSAGCFKQFFFVSEANLKGWLEKNPKASGKQVTIHQALADKMKLTPAQIAGACKIGECVPPK